MKKAMYTFLLIATALVFGIYLIHSKNPEKHEQKVEMPVSSAPASLAESQTALEAVAVPMILSGEAEAPVWTSTTPAAHRARVVYPDPLLLSSRPSLSVGDRLDLAVFDDALLTSIIHDVTEYPNGAIGMTARLDGDFKGFLYLSYSDGQMLAHADIIGGNDYYVSYDPGLQAHVAIEIDRKNSDYQEDCETCRTEREEAYVSEVEGDQIAYGGGGEGLIAETVLFDDPPDSVVVDVMIVYTPAAKTWAASHGGINNNITLAMQKSNTTHGNSNTKMSLNLVHTAEIAYTESGSASADLNALRDKGDGDMDDVHTWRNTYNADFICLFEDEPGTGGIAGLMSDADGQPHKAFCLARVQQSSWTYTVVHEWAHNMGCGHSATQTTQQGPGIIYSYSSGWQWNDTKAAYPLVGYCSVMTYEDFDSFGDPEYERVPHFSNPDIDYTGDSTNPTGDAVNGDNARAIRNVRHVCAEFRFPVEKIDQFPSTNNFEFGFRPWTYYTAAERDWYLNSGSTSTTSTGPSAAYEGSRYGYIEASITGEGHPGKTGVLQAEFDFAGITNPKINYAYHMYGPAMGTLYLEASANSGQSWATLWSLSGNQGNAWYTNQVDLSAYEGLSSVTLRFRGVTGNNITSDMALDSVVVSGDIWDMDGDGIPDYWEILYFGGPTNAVPTANPDFDNHNNLQEYIAGLNPTNSDGLFLRNLSVGANNIFTWNPVSGRIYSVFWTDDLVLNDFTLLQTNLTSGVFMDTVHSAESNGFYKLEVDVAP